MCLFLTNQILLKYISNFLIKFGKNCGKGRKLCLKVFCSFTTIFLKALWERSGCGKFIILFNTTHMKKKNTCSEDILILNGIP